jgi:histidine triad (HIT) family protein
MSDFYCDQIINGNLLVDIVWETENILAFHHTKPYFEVHVVIISKQHIDSLSSPKSAAPELAIDFLQAIQIITSQLEQKWGGCRVSSNVGNYQISQHLHWYVHAGKRLRDESGSLLTS